MKDDLKPVDSSNNGNGSDVTETITIPEHGQPSDIKKALHQLSRIANALAGRVLIGGAFGEPGAADPIVQNIVQCAGTAGTAMALYEQREAQRQQLLVPQMQMGPPGRGRA
jgi:hypothetical protein